MKLTSINKWRQPLTSMAPKPMFTSDQSFFIPDTLRLLVTDAYTIAVSNISAFPQKKVRMSLRS